MFVYNKYVCSILIVMGLLFSCKSEKSSKEGSGTGTNATNDSGSVFNDGETQTPSTTSGTGSGTGSGNATTGNETTGNNTTTGSNTTGGNTSNNDEKITLMRERNANEVYFSSIDFTSPLGAHIPKGPDCPTGSLWLLRFQDCGGNNCLGKNRVCGKVADWKNVTSESDVLVDLVMSPIYFPNPTPSCPIYTLNDGNNNIIVTLTGTANKQVQNCNATGTATGCSSGVLEMCSYHTKAKNLPLNTKVLQKVVASPEWKRSAENEEEFKKYFVVRGVINTWLTSDIATNPTAQKNFDAKIRERVKIVCNNMTTRDRAANILKVDESYEPLVYGNSIVPHCHYAYGDGIDCADYAVLCGLYDEI